MTSWKNERRFFIYNYFLKCSKLKKWNKFLSSLFLKIQLCSTVECLHDISHPRQFLIRSFWDTHQVQAIVLGLCGQVRLSIVLVTSVFFWHGVNFEKFAWLSSPWQSPRSRWSGGAGRAYRACGCANTCAGPPPGYKWRKSMKKKIKVACHMYFWGGCACFEFSHKLSLI